MDRFTPSSRRTRFRRKAAEVKKMLNEAQAPTSPEIAFSCIRFDGQSVPAKISCQSDGYIATTPCTIYSSSFENDDLSLENSYSTAVHKNYELGSGDDGSHSLESVAMICRLSECNRCEPFFEPDDWNARAVDSSGEESGDDFNLQDQLAQWSISHGLSHSAVDDLLRILNPLHPDLPLTAKSMLHTKRKIKIKLVAGGDYYYLGLKYWLEFYRLHKLLPSSTEELTLHVNIDGIPLFRSSNMSLWPVLCSIKEVGSVFPVAIFCSHHKPTSIDDYLDDFVAELKTLHHSGFVDQNGKCVHLKLAAVICDAPARAFVKAVKTHTAYNSCERCVQHGTWYRKITFQDMDAPLRTDEAFKNREDPDHHVGISPFQTLGIGMITSFPLDYMHLICLGVVRRLIHLWVNGPRSCKLSQINVTTISDRLAAVKSYIPREFGRKPRSLSEYRLWKATELRLFLLYVGPIVLKGLIPHEQYSNFLDLSVATRILLSQSLLACYQDYSSKLMKYFVESFSNLYGRDQLVYNVHSLIHVADDAKVFGVLDNVSSFKYESYLGQMKRLVRRPQQPCVQIVHRILEGGYVTKSVDSQSPAFRFRKPHMDGPVTKSLLHCEQYKQFQGAQCFISTELGDNCFEVHGKIGIVRNILKKAVRDSDHGWVLFEEFEMLQSFFEDPMDSKLLSVFFVKRQEVCCKIYSLSDVRNKYVMCPFKDGYVVVPQLHF